MKEIKKGTLQQRLATAKMLTYTLSALIIPVVIFGMYQNNKLDKTIAEALALGKSRRC
jgi:hypothetical protein